MGGSVREGALRFLDRALTNRPSYWKWARAYYYVGRKPVEDRAEGRLRAAFLMPDVRGAGCDEIMRLRASRQPCARSGTCSPQSRALTSRWSPWSMDAAWRVDSSLRSHAISSQRPPQLASSTPILLVACFRQEARRSGFQNG